MVSEFYQREIFTDKDYGEFKKDLTHQQDLFKKIDEIIAKDEQLAEPTRLAIRFIIEQLKITNCKFVQLVERLDPLPF